MEEFLCSLEIKEYPLELLTLGKDVDYTECFKSLILSGKSLSEAMSILKQIKKIFGKHELYI